MDCLGGNAGKSRFSAGGTASCDPWEGSFVCAAESEPERLCVEARDEGREGRCRRVCEK